MTRDEFLKSAIALLGTTALGARADTPFPSKPVRFIQPSAPGGVLDLVARSVAPTMQDTLGQPIVVESRTGGQQAIAANTVARSVPDGHTIMLGTSVQLAILPHLANWLQYDARKDFVAVALLGRSFPVFVVRADSPIKTFQELMAAGHVPGTGPNYGTAAIGSSSHMAVELFRQRAKLNYQHVPFTGSAPTLTAVMGGHTEFAVDNESSVLPHLQAGRLRALATAAGTRSSKMPGVPTVSEFGLSDFEVSGWFMVCAPAGTPAAVVSTLHSAVAKALKQNDVLARFEASGITPATSTPETATAFLQSEYERWGQVIKAGGIKFE